MSQSDEAIDASYGFCRRTTRRAHSNFSLCFLLLRRAKRRAMDALYSFMRHTDDLADNRQPVALRREALAKWRKSLQAALSGGADLATTGQPDQDRGQYPADQPGKLLLPALADTVRRFQIPPEHLFAVIEGAEMDLDRRTYETFDDLAQYCRRVASAVGLACIHVWGFRGPDAFEPARKCGLAFQITNILRDLREDAEVGRVYLPMEDLRRCHYSVDDLAASVADQRFDRLMEFQIDRARRLYHEGAELFDLLEPDGRRIFGLMTSIYHRLLREIQRRPGDVFRRRVQLPRWRRLALAARWAVLPARRSDLP
jgi:phytoene synthase